MSVNLPAAGVWAFDTSHSSVEFVARHLMIAKVRGGFKAFSGSVTVADPVEDSSVEVIIEAASLSTGDENRDAHVRGEEFLDVERFPTITFRGTGPRRSGSGWVLSGDLTVRDVTRTVDLEIEALGVLSDPWGNEKAAFSASTEIDREEFGVTWNAALEAGGVLVGNKVRIEIDVQLARQG